MCNRHPHTTSLHVQGVKTGTKPYAPWFMCGGTTSYIPYHRFHQHRKHKIGLHTPDTPMLTSILFICQPYPWFYYLLPSHTGKQCKTTAAKCPVVGFLGRTLAEKYGKSILMNGLHFWNKINKFMKEQKWIYLSYCFSVRYIASNTTKVQLSLLILLNQTLSRYLGTYEYMYSSFRQQM